MANSFLQVNIRGVVNGQYRENVQHWQVAGHADQQHWTTANDFVNAWNSGIKTSFLNCLPPDYGLEGIFARVIGPDSTGPYAAVEYLFMDQIGTRGSNCVSEALCPCIVLIPPMGIKSAGRIFMPAVAESDYSLNVASVGYTTAITTYMTNNLAGISVSGGLATLSIYSRKTNQFNAVSAYNLSPAIGYQRNRSKPLGV